MDAYEATRIVFARIQTIDPENSAKIMGLLLLQDHGEKEMIRLAFGPESLIHSLVLRARRDLNLMSGPLQSPAPVSPSTCKASSPGFVLNRQNSSGKELSKFYNGVSSGGDFVDELSHQEQFLYPEVECPSPGWGTNGHLGRNCSLNGSGDLSGLVDGIGWKPCMYFARGYCKNGSDCKFVHGLLDESPVSVSKMDAVEKQCNELLLRSKNLRIGVSGSGSQLMASAFPYSPIRSPSESNKSLNFLLQQQQQNENQRAAALMLEEDESPNFIARSRFDRSDFIPGSRQIYLTFPADSIFKEEDVSNYFSIYGPVQDVRIPYQQKRMFGFVTFMFPETVKLILAKGNPHFVCDARVLVKPYKEKGKLPDKFRKFQLQGERGDFSLCASPTGLGLDSRGDLYDLQQLGARMMYNNGSSQGLLLRRKLEEQHQAAELQKAIEFQNRRFMGLQLIDLKNRNFSSSPSFNNTTINNNSPTFTTADNSNAMSSAKGDQNLNSCHGFLNQTLVNTLADKEESNVEGNIKIDRQFQESAEHNLPDSPFASPTKSSTVLDHLTAPEQDIVNNSGSNNNHIISPTFLPSSTLNMASPKSCFFPMARFSSNHGAIGM